MQNSSTQPPHLLLLWRRDGLFPWKTTQRPTRRGAGAFFFLFLLVFCFLQTPAPFDMLGSAIRLFAGSNWQGREWRDLDEGSWWPVAPSTEEEEERSEISGLGQG